MNENSMNYSVREYIKEVEKRLPEWLKDKKEHKEILADLEEHLWSKAAELSENGQPDEKSVTLAIEHMGTPQNIAKEYKRRGEPKYYITKELWPYYTKALGAVFAVILTLVIIGLIVTFFTGNGSFESLVGGLVTGIQTGLLLSFTIVTIVFVALSHEGYFPEDFKSKKEQQMMKQLGEQELEKEIAQNQTLKQPLKPFIKPTGEIIGGGIGLVFGIVLLSQPFPTYMFFPDFLMILRLFGLLTMLECSLDIARGIIGNRRPRTHQILHALIIPLKLLVIPLLGMLMNRPEIFPLFSEPWIHVGIPVEAYGLYRGILGVIIAIAFLTTIENFYNIIKIQKYK
ncbi:MAG: hypothetical protein KGD61_06675 [Candidatus Lokiarchaeota archaeon]|nr:hypothetical protein [Candidatus Lokiarchaeota archaeon]